MQRLALALAVTAITLCWGSVTRAQVASIRWGSTVCQPLPSWYPRGWELMVRYPCVTYVYGPSYYPPAYYPYPASPPAPASVDSCRTSGPSPAISASRLVVVK